MKTSQPFEQGKALDRIILAISQTLKVLREQDGQEGYRRDFDRALHIKIVRAPVQK